MWAGESTLANNRDGGRALGLALALGLSASSAWGAEAPPSAASSIEQDFLLPEHGLNIAVGVGAASHPKAIGSRANTVDAVPIFEVQWGPDLHVSLDDGLTFTPVHFGPLSAGPVVEFKQSYGAPRLARGLRNADTWEVGLVGRLASPIGNFEGRLRRSVDGDATHSADLSYDMAVRASERLALAFEVRGSWSNEAFLIPGKKTKKVPKPTPTSKEADFYAAGVQLAAIYRLSDQWMLTGLVSKDEIVAADKKVLLLSTRSVPVVSLIITRRFRIR